MSVQNQQERSGLNDGIEDRYLITSDTVAEIRTYYVFRIGVIKTLVEQFYLHFTRLIEVTECLEEVSKSEDIVEEAQSWRDDPTVCSSDQEIKIRAQAGMVVFYKYKKMLSARGLLALPSRVK